MDGNQTKRYTCLCGARPNFMKIAPILRAMSHVAEAQTRLIHTGQHYDDCLSGRFFGELKIPAPTINLGVGSGSSAFQTAEIMKRLEPVLIDDRPDYLIVVGDVNSTLAGALTAAKLGIGVAHVEAGLRSFDRTMPEEINRVLTDAISDLLFVSEPSGVENLLREGISGERIHFVGNVMIDTLLRFRGVASDSSILDRFAFRAGTYVLATLHRPSNVDQPEALRAIVEALRCIADDLPVVFPVHPRTRVRLEEFGMIASLTSHRRIHAVEPLGYLDFLKLMGNATVVLTDSGGIQEETTILNVPCLTLRENTERPITLTKGTNRLVKVEKDAIVDAYRDVRRNPSRPVDVPEMWDGRAAERIIDILTGSSAPGANSVGAKKANRRSMGVQLESVAAAATLDRLGSPKPDPAGLAPSRPHAGRESIADGVTL